MWYYEQDGNRMGPVDEATIRGLVANHTLSIDTLVWTNGMAEWTPLQQTQLSSGLPLPPPSPQEAPSSPGHHEAPFRHPPETKDRVAYVLLAVLLGFGIHNLYAGYTNRGIIQLVLSVLCCLWPFMWIWAIIEACTVTQDANGVRFK